MNVQTAEETSESAGNGNGDDADADADAGAGAGDFVQRDDGNEEALMMMSEETEEDHTSNENNGIFCSILNVVIDHTMEEPTPLEPREWNHPKRKLIQVPVIRVFGPLLRRSSSRRQQQPRQTGCLYIHGAFPYLLARPVWAGPDGSLRRIKPPEGGNTDWDDSNSVQSIADSIGSILETTLQSLEIGRDSDENKNNDDNSNKNSGSSKEQKQLQTFIRQVTVVEGRGFYSYCPGPPAPFLKIEYYNPKSRWKVKLMLEKGLEVPMMYHPDPTIYDRPIEPPGEALRFNCYEAHIPYTMQFFKDKNLSGMSYIHIAKGWLREDLPREYAELTKRYYRLDENLTDIIEKSKGSIFLQANTPKRYLWSEAMNMDEFSTPPSHDQPQTTPTQTTQQQKHDEEEKTEEDEAITMEPATTTTTTKTFEPPKKQTSTDIEIDCTVNDLRNIETVMKTLPSDQEERDQIQWRAVPSLQEIWRQERRRMAKLLPPKVTNEVLSTLHDDGNNNNNNNSSNNNSNDGKAFTLNPKKDADRSSSEKEAAKGMWSLVGMTDGLTEDFLRALHDIIKRHKQTVDNADEALKQKKIQEMDETSRPMKMAPQDSNSPDSKEAIESPPDFPVGGEGAEQDQKLTATTADSNEAINAFDALTGENLEITGPSPLQEMTKTPDMEEAVSSIRDMAQGVTETLAPNLPQEEAPIMEEEEEAAEATSPLAEEARKAVARSSPSQEDRFDSPGRLFEGSEERDAVSSSPDFVDGKCSQQISYSCSQEMQDASAAAFENINLDEYCQRLERGDGIIDDTGHELEDFIDPETLQPFDELYFGKERCRIVFRVETDSAGIDRVCGGKYKNCARHSTGFSDAERSNPGYYKTVFSGAFVDGRCEVCQNEEDDDVAFLTAQTQIPETQHGTYSTPQYLLSQAGSQFSHLPLQHSSQECYSSGEHLEHNERGADIDDAVADGAPLKKLKKMPSPKESNTLKDDGQSNSKKGQEIVTPASIAPICMPPTRKGVPGTRSLHVKESQDNPPSWLLHASKYTAQREKICSELDMPLLPPGSSLCIQTSQVPPTRKDVRRWCRKHIGRKRARKKRARLKAEASEPSKRTRKKSLEIDSNSRMLVAAETEDEHCPVGDFQGEVEDAQRTEMSQPWKLTMTQKTQNASKQPMKDKIEKKHHTQEDGQETSKHTPNADGRKKSHQSQKEHSESVSNDQSQNSGHQLDGIGNQGGRIHVQGGGGLKAKTRQSQGLTALSLANQISCEKDPLNSFLPSPISFMSIEIHVQCRTGSSRLDSKKISMAPDSSKDKVYLCAYIFGIDPGGGMTLDILSRGCLFVPLATENSDRKAQMTTMQSSMPNSTLGASAPLEVECVNDERSLLQRIASIVRVKDPDMLLSWDTQGAGLGYLIERGEALGRQENQGNETNRSAAIDLAKLLGRNPMCTDKSHFSVNAPAETSVDTTGDQTNRLMSDSNWRGSGLGSDWDERVGAGAAAASIIGRLVFSGWKIVSEEVKHPNASYLPAVVASVLGRRIPHHDGLTLSRWYASGEAQRWRVANHVLVQAFSTLQLFDALDIIGRAGEAARLSGVEFSQSFPGIRGSQYKVEGVLLRALQSLRSDERGSKKGKKIGAGSVSMSSPYRPLTEGTNSQSPWKRRREGDSINLDGRHYFFFSPSLEDTNKQEALEVQALTLEPQSGIYKEPIVVCDFTALYPSLVIAYNLCYSTCVGKIEYHSTRREMQMAGRTCGRVGPMSYPERRSGTVFSHHFKSLENQEISEFKAGASNDRAYVAPTGCIYVSENVLKGVLPQVLDEMLTTRAMLKRAAKAYKKHVKDLSPAILRQLEARQLALKYVANVTYGYTSATFSGRCAMPLLADTIVECGRRTLQKAIDLANKWGREHSKWRGCRVIYGDTDSLFVRLPGRSHVEAFEFGEELCKAVTADNPPPVELKLEKVYMGSIMQTMKRYCGMKVESKTQKKPVFEAKGLETVRRDQCALTQKILRNALITLFRDGVEAVKEYLFRQWSLIFAGQLPVSNFVLTGRVRSRYRGDREGPVQAVLAKRIGEADPGRIIRHRQRLPYVIVATPGITFTLKDCVLTPLELLERWDFYGIHSAYYIEKHVNASLQRCLGLSPYRIDINAWYQACPKPRRRIHFWPVRSNSGAMISSYFGSDVCSLCHRRCLASGRDMVVICPDCRKDETKAAQVAMMMVNEAQKLAFNVAKECSKCNQCFEDSSTFATVRCDMERTVDFTKPLGSEALNLPLSNCVCIECPNTYLRHRLREREIEATSACHVLGIL